MRGPTDDDDDSSRSPRCHIANRNHGKLVPDSIFAFVFSVCRQIQSEGSVFDN